MSNADIGAATFLSGATVMTHVGRMLRVVDFPCLKLDVHVEAVEMGPNGNVGVPRARRRSDRESPWPLPRR
jgi:hypothetical protein